MRHQIIVLIVAGLVLFTFGCDGTTNNEGAVYSLADSNKESAPDTNTASASVSIPDVTPFWDNSGIIIDTELMNTFAVMYSAEYGAAANALDFFCGYLPLKSADDFCQAGQSKELIQKYLGNMYVSGYYGGVWLRDVLFSNSSDIQPDDIMGLIMSKFPDVMKNLMALGADELVFKGIGTLAGASIDTSLYGSALAVKAANRLTVDVFLMIYGYDYGYYYYLVDNPPSGVSSDCPLACNSFMDCSMKNIELSTLTTYKPVLEDLLHPDYLNIYSAKAMRWVEMNNAMNIVGKGSVSLGNLVWDGIMSSSEMMNDAYLPLMDLSARFMLVSELTLLPTMKGYADLDTTAGRCGLLQEAGMLVWLGAYVMGLGSDLPEGTFPALMCP